MDDFEKELKIGFLQEADQLVSDAEQCFLDLEANPADQPTIEKIFRIAHNIKGSSKAVGFDALGAFTHEFESFLLKCKSGAIQILPETISLMLQSNDSIKQTIKLLQSDFNASIPYTDLIEKLKNFSISPAEKLESQALGEEVRDAVDPSPLQETSPPPQLEESFSGEPAEQSQESASWMMDSSPACDAPIAATPSPQKVQTSSADESIRVSLSRLENLLNFVGEMVILQTVMREQAYSGNPIPLRRTIHQIGKVTKEIQDVTMSLRMVPIKQTFQKMQRIVRDTSSALGKKVNLILQGEETEVDKTILEALSDPLVHLVRNAVDHGIESKEARLEKGKPEAGTVQLRAYHQSGKLIIEVNDDGGGIPADRLREKAIEKGILRPNQSITDREAIMLIFHPGFSTKSQVTEVSGRGVGMDVVKTNIESISGEILVETHTGKGSQFKIILPLTLAIIDGMTIMCCGERYVIPLTHVHESLKVEAKDLRQTSGAGEVLLLRGESLPVLRLSRVFHRRNTADEKIAVVVRMTGQPFAVLVDDIIGQHQVVIKKLGAEMNGRRGISGSAILGDGRPALILELQELMSSTSLNHFQEQRVS